MGITETSCLILNLSAQGVLMSYRKDLGRLGDTTLPSAQLRQQSLQLDSGQVKGSESNLLRFLGCKEEVGRTVLSGFQDSVKVALQ